jgi:RND family efflux transporter MFP subunit
MKVASTLFLRFLMVLVFLILISPEAEAVEVDGIIEPYMTVKIGSGVPGIIGNIAVDRGDFVKKDQVLSTLRSGVEKASMEIARVRAEMEATIKGKKAQLDFYLRKQKRSELLYKEDVMPLSQMDEVETNRIIVEMELQEALENKQLAELEYKRTVEVLKRMTICSPIDGVVVERFLSPGEYVENQPIMKLAQIDPLNIEVILPVNLFSSIKVGMRAKVIPEAPIGGQYMAEVKIIDRVIDAASDTFGVRLELPNPKNSLPAGLKCKVFFPGR